MSQGIYVVVENKYGERLEHVSIRFGSSNCCTTGGNGTCWCYTNWGTATTRASRYGYVSEWQQVHVPKDYWTDVYFTVSSGYELHASIEGTVHDESNNPLSDMMVWGMGVLGNTKYWGCETKSDGSYSLPINSAGSYTIYCGKNNYDMVTASNYSQVSSAPTSTTTINFTGDYTASRIENDMDTEIGVSNRSCIIKDDLSSGYYYIADDGDTNTVFAKTRKWTGGLLNTYEINVDPELVRDGYGGSQYD